MIVTEIEQSVASDLALRIGQSTLPRTLGVLHLSEVIHRLMERLQPQRFDPSQPMNLLKVEVGLLVETAIERALSDKFATVRPGEVWGEMDGCTIVMSPDGVNPAYAAGEEYKCTEMSCGVPDGATSPFVDADGCIGEKFLHWFFQMKGYAKWLDTRYFILTVLFLRGDWKWTKVKGRSIPPQMQLKRYWIEFTDEEVEGNWTMLTNVAREEHMLALPA